MGRNRSAGREDAASCSASSITPAHRETRRAACQTALWPICLKMRQGADKRDGDTRPDSIYHNLSPRRPTPRRCSYLSLPQSLQWTQADIFPLSPAVGQARSATISTISVIASKNKRTCVLFEQRASPSLCLLCIIITFMELNICLSAK